MWIANNQQNRVNYLKDFVGSMHNNIFQVQRIRGLFYRPNHSEEEEDSLDIKLTIDKLPTIDIITIYATTVHRDDCPPSSKLGN